MFKRSKICLHARMSVGNEANFQLVNIGRARKMLTTESTKLDVHTLVNSRLDYCNSLLAGINRGLLKRLQNVQRTAARLITGKRKYDPISDDLIELHWLPVEQRIDFKILVRMYNAIRHQSCPNYGLIPGTSAPHLLHLNLFSLELIISHLPITPFHVMHPANEQKCSQTPFYASLSQTFWF